MIGHTPTLRFYRDNFCPEYCQIVLYRINRHESSLSPRPRGSTPNLMVGEEEQQAELRVFRVPALNFEALWVRYEGEGRDVLIPCTARGGRPIHSGALPIFK